MTNHPTNPNARSYASSPGRQRHCWLIRCRFGLALLAWSCCLPVDHASGQTVVANQPPARVARLTDPSERSIEKERALIREVRDPELMLRLEPSESVIIRTNYPIDRQAISNEDVFEVRPFGPDEVEIIGKNVGQAVLTFWFTVAPGDTQMLRYLVSVDDVRQRRLVREHRYKQLQARINEIFPNSQVFLFPIEDKVIVRGQARDGKEASEIMRLLGQSNTYRSMEVDRDPTDPLQDNTEDVLTDIEPYQFINMLNVPGEQQVMLKVRIAELIRSSSRELGVNIRVVTDSFSISHLISGAGNVSAILSDGDVKFLMKAISTHGYGRILAEPTLVTVSGKPAKFLAGGEFAVPTVVGVDGVGAASTTFHGYGTELVFTPTVLDKDLVRLEVSPSFSTLNNDATVGGIPGLNLRKVDTTVDLREGQWLAIAGLIQVEQGGQRTRLPFIGDIPAIGGLFANENTSRNETELIVLVSPELVHPLDAVDIPMLLPGMEVTDPTDKDFFFHSMIEGSPEKDYRSTVRPASVSHVAGLSKTRHRNKQNHHRQQMQAESAYIAGPSGLSK